MKKILLTILLIVTCIPFVSALEEPSIEFIPSRFSANSSFLAVADPHTLNESIRMMWAFPGYKHGYGSFPRIGDKWVCYFSNTDSTSTCGPSPFTQSNIGFDPYTLIINSMNQLGETANKTINLYVGGIQLTSNISVYNKTVFIKVWAKGDVSGISYNTYFADNITLVPDKSGDLNYKIEIFGYVGNITLDPGEYYIAFTANSTDGIDFGGSVAKIIIQPDIKEIPISAEYKIKADDVILNVNINKNQHWETANFQIKNLGNETLYNLKTRVPDELSDILDIKLANDTLEPNDAMYFSVILDGIENAIWINTMVDVLSGSDVIKQIPVNISVSVKNECEGVVCPSTISLIITPTIWTGDFLIGEDVSKEFTIRNNGDELLTINDYTLDTNLIGIADVVHPTSINPKSSDSLTITLAPTEPGSYVGEVAINTDAGSEYILIAVNFFKDISYDIENLKQKIDSLKVNISDQYYGIITNIETLLEDAESMFEYDYAAAKQKVDEARAELSVLSDVIEVPTPEPPPPADFTWIFIILIIAGVGIGLYFYFTKYRHKTFEEEEEFEEEEFY
jgi:hypothetical protein